MLAIVSIKDRIFTARELGRVIHRTRRQQGLTQADLAERANVARSALQKLEEGRGTVNLDTVVKLMTALSLDLAVVTRASPHALFDQPHEQ